MRIAVIACLILMHVQPMAAAPQPRPLNELLVGCQTLRACIGVVDANIPARDPYHEVISNDWAEPFKKFGDAAKRELIRRATGRHEGWRHFADSVLRQWGGWTEADVPTIREVLRANPGGQVAWLLGEIGTPAAIEGLVEDLKSNQPGPGQTGSVLRNLGPKAVRYMMFVPEGEFAISTFAYTLGEMKEEDAASVIRLWTSVALDPRQPSSTRISILRSLVFNRHARLAASAFHPLLDDPDPAIREHALEVLRWARDPIMREPTVIPRIAEFCTPTTDPFSIPQFSTPRKTPECLAEIAAFGEAAYSYRATIADKFLSSPNRTDRADGASALGFLDYQPSVPQLIAMLDEADWRVVYSAARALGWLGSMDAIPSLNKVAENFWLPEVRQKAREVSEALQTTGRVARPAPLEANVDAFSGPGAIRIDMSVISETPDPPNCQADLQWRGQKIVFPSAQGYETTVQYRDGNIVGEDRGEFGGGLTWRPRRGKPETLHDRNVTGVVRFGEGAIVVVNAQGPFATGDSYALRVYRDQQGNWQLVEVARFPTGAFGVTVLGQDLFATWGFSNNFRVVVFSSAGVLGLANCGPGN